MVINRLIDSLLFFIMVDSKNKSTSNGKGLIISKAQ